MLESHAESDACFARAARVRTVRRSAVRRAGAGPSRERPPCPSWGPESVAEIASLCAAAMPRRHRPTSCRRALFAPDQRAVVRLLARDGRWSAVVRDNDGVDGYIRLLLLAPGHRGHGLGHELLQAAEHDLDGVPKRLPSGADAPYFLFPGVPVRGDRPVLPARAAPLRTRKRPTTTFDIRPRRVTPRPRSGDRGPEARNARRSSNGCPGTGRTGKPRSCVPSIRGRCYCGATRTTITGFCAYDVNRAGTLGPIASRPDLIGKGRGGAPLLLGRPAIVCETPAGPPSKLLWVGPMVPYARLGGQVGRLFFRLPSADSEP